MTEKAFEWNDENSAEVVERYSEVAGEDYKTRTAMDTELADELGISVPRVRSKLVSEEVYVGKPKAESNGTAGTRKSAYVAFIGTMIGASVPSFEGATKEDLIKVAAFLKGKNDEYEVANAAE